MSFSLVRGEITTCKLHLRRIGGDKIIESIFVRHLLIVICAEFEESIEDIISRRAKKQPDAQIASYVSSTLNNIVRGLKVSDLKGLLRKFDPALATAFDSHLSGSQGLVSLDNIVTNRDKVAHKRQVINMTFNDVRRDFIQSLRVLREFGNLLGEQLR